jgi:hypothetical protein
VLQVKCSAHAGMLNLERRYCLVRNQPKHNPALTFLLEKVKKCDVAFVFICATGKTSSYY